MPVTLAAFACADEPGRRPLRTSPGGPSDAHRDAARPDKLRGESRVDGPAPGNPWQTRRSHAPVRGNLEDEPERRRVPPRRPRRLSGRLPGPPAPGCVAGFL